MEFSIEKPDVLKTARTKQFMDIFKNDSVEKLIKKAENPYVYWDTVKHWPMPEGIEPNEVWAAIKFTRYLKRRSSVILDKKGKSFSWLEPDHFAELVHRADMNLGGNLFASINGVSDDLKSHLLTRGIIEEAITSSQLEGARTDRKSAKRMIIEKRNPANKDEKMILNNYNAMRFVEDELKNQRMSEEVLLRLHRALTNGVLDDSEVGRYRRDDDNIVVRDSDVSGGVVYHVPPSEKILTEEIKRLVAYANGDIKDDGFTHPVIKAIIIHFWIGYLHPFTDGNGRIARILFYWSVLKDGYWGFSYLPLSRVIKNSPAQYRDAYVYSEQDDGDLTYFIDYNLRKMAQAMNEFVIYLSRKREENVKMLKIAQKEYRLNDRQIQTLRFLYKDLDASTSVKTYMRIHEVSRMTAVNDLKELGVEGLLKKEKRGRNVFYYATEKAKKLFGK